MRSACAVVLALAVAQAAPRIGFRTRIAGSELYAVAVTREGDIYVAGATYATDFPANGFQKHPTVSNFYRVEGGAARPSYGLPGVQSVSVDRQHPGTVWAGGFVSTDSGETWTQKLAGVRYVAVDPADGSIVYAADQDFVYKSTDGGASWTPLPLPVQKGTISGVAIDPSQPSTVFVRASGFYRSTDGGQTWSTVSGYPLAFDPNQPGLMYGVTYLASVRSTDHGLTWAAIESPWCYPRVFQSVGPPHRAIASSFGADPRKPGVAYATFCDGIQGQSSGLYRSTDGGVTWTKTVVPGYVQSLAADIASGILYALTNDALVRSLDGFATWTTEPLRTSAGSLATGVSSGPGGLAPLYVYGSNGRTVFVAQLDRAGALKAATYVGQTAVYPYSTANILLSTSGGLWVVGTVQGGNYAWKLSADLTRLEKEIVFPAKDGEYFLIPTGLAVDSSGTVRVPVLRTTQSCYQQDSFHPPQCRTLQDGRMYSLDPSGLRAPELTYLTNKVPGPAVADPAGGFYVMAENTFGKFSSSGALEYSTAIPGSIKAATLNSDGDLIVTGQGCGERTSGGAFVAKLSARDGSVLYSSCLGGDSGTALAMDRRCHLSDQGLCARL